MDPALVAPRLTKWSPRERFSLLIAKEPGGSRAALALLFLSLRVRVSPQSAAGLGLRVLGHVPAEPALGDRVGPATWNAAVGLVRAGGRTRGCCILREGGMWWAPGLSWAVCIPSWRTARCRSRPPDTTWTSTCPCWSRRMIWRVSTRRSGEAHGVAEPSGDRTGACEHWGPWVGGPRWSRCRCSRVVSPHPRKGRRPTLILRTQLSVRVHAIIEKLYNSQGPELRRSLFSLKQLFQEDKDLVPEFVNLEGLTCLIKVGAEADQNYQNYILRGWCPGTGQLREEGSWRLVGGSTRVWLGYLAGSLPALARGVATLHRAGKALPCSPPHRPARSLPCSLEPDHALRGRDAGCHQPQRDRPVAVHAVRKPVSPGGEDGAEAAAGVRGVHRAQRSAPHPRCQRRGPGERWVQPWSPAGRCPLPWPICHLPPVAFPRHVPVVQPDGHPGATQRG
uniref:Uncharacterized protein n=1 Tax=Calidris pygmaea TaxID=425635 RepID=A0A8C3KA67_9CHAR